MNNSDTITLPRALVKQALEALTNCTSEYSHRCNRCDSEVDPDGNVASALRAALEQQVMRETAPNGATHIQPQQGAFYKRVDEKWYVWSRMEDGRPHRWYISPGTVESCLKPISAATEQPQGEQEPFTVLVRKRSWLANQWEAAPRGFPDYGRSWADERVNVYTHPQPKREPLTDEQKLELVGSYFADTWAQAAALGLLHDFERAHGIGGEA